MGQQTKEKMNKKKSRRQEQIKGKFWNPLCRLYYWFERGTDYEREREMVLPNKANTYGPLSKLLSDVTIANGGVMPNIHNLLLPKKAGSSKASGGDDDS